MGFGSLLKFEWDIVMARLRGFGVRGNEIADVSQYWDFSGLMSPLNKQEFCYFRRFAWVLAALALP